MAGWLEADGVSAALVTAAGAVVLWVAKELALSARSYLQERAKRREAILRFYMDVLLRVENCTALADPAVRLAFGEQLRAYARRVRPFVAYGVHTDDREAYDLIERYLYSLPDRAAISIRKMIVTDDLFVEQYRKISTPAFTGLTLERQLAVTDDLFNSARETRDAGRDALFEVECLPGFADLYKTRRRREK